MKKLIAMLMTMAMILSIVGIMPTKTKANSFGVESQNHCFRKDYNGRDDYYAGNDYRV